MNGHSRHDNRRSHDLRPISITYGIYEYAAGSALFCLGKTKVLCAVTLQQSVPPFLKGKGTGWLSAEYALLPAATQVRTNREITAMKRQGRSVEISRLISRALRAVVDLSVLGERSITVDCDVLQADGGTRTASITGAYAALVMAQQEWLNKGIISRPFLIDGIAAVSVAVLADEQLLLDPDYVEDSAAIADINVVMTYTGKLVELQGGAEKESVPWEVVPTIGQLAQGAVTTFRDFMQANPAPIGIISRTAETAVKSASKSALFSLANRQHRPVSS